MSRRALTEATALLRDESGETYIEWMYPLVLVLIVGAMTSGQIAGRWEPARFHISIGIPFLDILR